ncbi:MAG TPA: molybdate ABC transporter substrate-binding protein, partial [Actinomycetes bacterium]|nr:molybdate ABC transporter substrate-binding protein [Actinomycetes bacterium]
ALILATAALLAGCSDTGGGTGSATPTGADSAGATPASGKITVFAAASLTDAFQQLGDQFEAAHPGAKVEFNFAASSALREQIIGGAPADVFASANESNMTQVVDAGLATGPAPFVTNVLQIAVPPDNPGQVAGLSDFAKPDLLIGLCAEEVPCGEFGRESLAKAGVTPSIDTNEPDVRSLITKVENGDLDAGIVYHTDVLAASDAVKGIDIPDDQNVVATYPIAALSGSGQADLASQFVEYVRSPDGQQVLESFGFRPA